MLDLKKLKIQIENIEKGLDELGRERLSAIWLQLETLQSEREPLDQEGRKLSKRIGLLKKQGEDAGVLLSEKKALSDRINSIDEEISRHAKCIDEIVTGASDQRNSEARIVATGTAAEYGWSAMKPIKILPFDTSIAPAWDEYVRTNPSSSIYHLSCWKNIVESAFQHETYYFYALDESNNVCGVLPMVRLKSGIFGDFVVSVPYFNYGGALGEHIEVELALMSHASKNFAPMSVGHVEWRDIKKREGYPVRDDKVAMLLRLPNSPDDLWQQLGAKLRAQIKKPQKLNPDVVIGGRELLDEFYHVFSINMRDLGTPVYSRKFFFTILEQVPESARILIVRHQGRPVSAAFLLGFREGLEIPWASTIREANQLSMNMLLYWEVLSFAIRSGYKVFDFGRSTRDAGTYKFKAQWGAEPRQLYWHYWLKSGGDLPKLNPDNPKFKLAIAIWQRLPVWLTQLIGPPVVKYLP